MSIEAMKQALEALELALVWVEYDNHVIVCDEAITSLRQAIAEADADADMEPLNYTVHVECKRCGSHERYDLTIDQPQRQPLTDEQIEKIAKQNGVWALFRSLLIFDFVREIEAAHGIKD